MAASSEGSVFSCTWDEDEIATFYAAIKRFGTRSHSAVRAIAHRIGTKSPVQVIGILHKLEERQSKLHVPDDHEREQFLTQLAEELTDEDELADEESKAEKLITEEERAFLDETHRTYASQTGVLNPYNLMKYSRRMYADLLPDQEEDIVLPAETLWFLEKKMWDFLGLILKEAHRMWGPQATPNYFYGKARKPVWGDPQRFTLRTKSEVIYAAMQTVPNRDLDAFFSRIDECNMTPFSTEVCNTSSDEDDSVNNMQVGK